MRRTGRWQRFGAAGLAAAILLAIPATALANAPTVTPIVDCVTVNADRSFTVLFGYTNSGPTAQYLKHGPDNSISPSSLDGAEPTSFDPGTTDGAFALNVPAGVTVTWTLHGHQVASASATTLPACSKPISLPKAGNGLGAVFALFVAGFWGVLIVRKMGRRNREATVAP